ncbi:hypothetical protein Poly24_35700 [Rosistilla carotiformis]|uniref:Uncharacterized protein n=1 Tax=Rosistilla carotiformis TaxID=2528017 RepID=A0A518JWD2_9BACT|nr:hypothetical protein [Rosistilla carotiformis]QDV69852.1 hypothetical protein Poly24_35700 [Rosistilla carotiformis]
MPKKKPLVPEKVKSRNITNAQRIAAVRRIQESIALSPLMTELAIEVTTRGGHIYLEYDDAGTTATMARITPMQESPAYALESETDSGWVLYGQGTPSRIMKLLCNDTLGTFHALGGIDQTLRNGRGAVPEIVQISTRTFAYQSTNAPCTLQEALYFYYGIPLVIVMAPREYYRLHAEPSLIETSADQRKILIRFCSRNPANPHIVGHGYYQRIRGDWYGIGVPPESGSTMDAAEAFLKSTL